MIAGWGFLSNQWEKLNEAPPSPRNRRPKLYFTSYGEKIKSMNKEERMGTSAKHSSCMTLKTLPRKADTGKTKFLTVEMTPG